jgi:hypothetical protein
LSSCLLVGFFARCSFPCNLLICTLWLRCRLFGTSRFSFSETKLFSALDSASAITLLALS